ncbi:MAG: hypothetical protein AAF984_10590, partial [Verrucomicrobiota bacterium]
GQHPLPDQQGSALKSNKCLGSTLIDMSPTDRSRIRLYEEEKKTLKSNKKSRSEVKNDSSRKKED